MSYQGLRANSIDVPATSRSFHDITLEDPAPNSDQSSITSRGSRRHGRRSRFANTFKGYFRRLRPNHRSTASDASSMEACLEGSRAPNDRVVSDSSAASNSTLVTRELELPQLVNQRQHGHVSFIPGDDYDVEERAGLKRTPESEAHDKFTVWSICMLVLALSTAGALVTYIVLAAIKYDWTYLLTRKYNPIDYQKTTTCVQTYASIIAYSTVTTTLYSYGQLYSHQSWRKGKPISSYVLVMRNSALGLADVFSQANTYRHLVGYILAFVSLSVFFMSSATEALVSPKPSLGPARSYQVRNYIEAAYAIPDYMKKNCRLPFSEDVACVEFRMLSQSYYNFQSWLTEWTRRVESNNSIEDRPRPTALWHEQISVTGSWLDKNRSLESSEYWDRAINNVTLALPHPMVARAASLKDNAKFIRQPGLVEKSSGRLEMTTRVTSPMINVLCAAASKKELGPLVFSSNNGSHKFNGTEYFLHASSLKDSIVHNNRHTILDDIFNWNDTYNPRPQFGTYPDENDTVKSDFKKAATRLHVLLKVPEDRRDKSSDKDYMICKFNSDLIGGCATIYHADSSGANLTTDCGSNNMAYPPIPSSNGGWGDPNWASLSTTWGNAVDFQQGLWGESVSHAQILGDMIPTSKRAGDVVPRDKPSVAEALAVFAGATTLMGAENTTTKQWTDSHPIFGKPQPEKFDAEIAWTEYMSGGKTVGWHYAMYPVFGILLLANLLSVIIMIFVRKGKQMVDFTQVKRAAMLMSNSTPNEARALSCRMEGLKEPKDQIFKVQPDNRNVFRAAPVKAKFYWDSKSFMNLSPSRYLSKRVVRSEVPKKPLVHSRSHLMHSRSQSVNSITPSYMSSGNQPSRRSMSDAQLLGTPAPNVRATEDDIGQYHAMEDNTEAASVHSPNSHRLSVPSPAENVLLAADYAAGDTDADYDGSEEEASSVLIHTPPPDSPDIPPEEVHEHEGEARRNSVILYRGARNRDSALFGSQDIDPSFIPEIRATAWD